MRYESLAIDPFNFGCLYELGKYAEMREMMRKDANDYDQLALDYCAAGAYTDAAKIWGMAIEETAVTPMTRYYMAWSLHESGNIVEAEAMYKEAVTISPEYCFPTRIEAILALNVAMKYNPPDARAPYYLGNLYYDKRQYDLCHSIVDKIV